jgi:Tol biopolymer transport system component
MQAGAAGSGRLHRADHLFAMNADGSGRRQLTFGPNSDFRPTWSPDGTLIAYWSYVAVECPEGEPDRAG